MNAKPTTICLGMAVIALCAISANAAPFTPGNLVLADAADDMLIEVSLGASEATVVQVVRWELGDTSRRRPLGVAFDPSGICYVGLTGVPTSATEQVEYPAGRGEILRIFPDGSMYFTVLSTEVTKGTWVSSNAPNEVFVMSNEPPPPFPSHSFRYRFAGENVIEETLFDVTMTPQSNGNGGNGKALILPDGRILIPSDMDPRINIYSDSGGAAIGSIPTSKGYRSLAYIEGTDYLLAIPGTNSVDRIGLDGTLHGTFDFTIDGLGGVWNFTILADGTERFAVSNHNGPAGSKSMIYIYDASDLENIYPDVLPIVGLQNFGDADGRATQLFDHAMVPVPVAVPDWALY
ncbi:MAG: hypothetical protein C4527_12330 [Candidatus Omnitrophota bacterium]|jgi:hypothetical protein|nr:MAG: hypothetical protein C4527_12330 [Candidatus Omnitrophota bacterium]